MIPRCASIAVSLCALSLLGVASAHAQMYKWVDERGVVLETLTAIKRAGADLILTYHAREAARWLRGQD